MKDRDDTTERLKKYVAYISLACILGMVFYVRLRLLGVPMERDEGEYAYMGQLLLKGIPPYADAYTMKLPGVSFMYAFFMALFGQSNEGIHAGLLVVNSISIYLVYLIARRVLDTGSAVISCATFAVLSLSQSVYGVYAHATHFVMLFSLSGFVLLLRHLSTGRMPTLFFSGLCFGMAFIMKQHSVMFICCAFLYLVWHTWKNPAAGRNKLLAAGALFLSGILLPYALIVLSAFQVGVLGKFWFWTVKYAREYVAEQSLAQGWNNFTTVFERIATPQIPFWLLAGAGIAVLFTKQRNNTDRFFIGSLFLFSFLAICPGLYFREHYFIMLLPAVALMVGMAVRAAAQCPSAAQLGRLKPFIPTMLLILAVGYGLILERQYYFFFNPEQVTRATYGPSPFPEAVQVAKYIRERTGANDRIAILGSEPEIFFYADRLSATRHIYMYGLMENQKFATQMQLEMVRDIEAAKPKYLVIVNLPSSWGDASLSSRRLIEWGEGYAARKYDLVGTIEIVDFNTTRYFWDDQATDYVPVSDVFLSVLKRKENS